MSQIQPASDSSDAATDWQLVADLRGDPTTAQAAMAALYARYHQSIYAYLLQRSHDRDAALDMVRDFFGGLLASDRLRGLEPERGSLRAWLLAALRNYERSTTWRATKTRDRLTLEAIADGLASEPTNEESDPERAYNRAWARELLERAFTRLREELLDDHRDMALPPLLTTSSREMVEAVSKQLGVRPTTVVMSLADLRARFRQLMREVIAEVVKTPSDIDAELRSMLDDLTG